MATNVTRPIGTTLSDDFLDQLVSGIADSRSRTPSSGGKPLLRLLKSGVWVFGQSNEPVQEGSEWAINPKQMGHGWVCWTSYSDSKTTNEKLGEVMVPVFQPMPERPEPVRGFEYAAQRSFELKCMTGDDEGEEVLYKTASDGGLSAANNFFAEFTARVNVVANRPWPVAIVQLLVTDYDHKKWGQTFKPVFEITGWADMNGERDTRARGAAPIAAKVAAAAPAKRVKAPLQTAAQTPQQEAADEPAPETASPAAATLRPGAAPRRQRPANRA
jgi:hypothetical protein